MISGVRCIVVTVRRSTGVNESTRPRSSGVISLSQREPLLSNRSSLPRFRAFRLGERLADHRRKARSAGDFGSLPIRDVQDRKSVV